MAHQPRKTEEDEEEADDNEVELRMSGSFDFGDHGGGAAVGVGTVGPFGAVGVLENLWRGVQLR